MFLENLARLAEKQPLVHRWLVGHYPHHQANRLQDAAGLKAHLDPLGHRSTTILYFGVDAQLPGLIEQLNGENNIVLIEDRPEKLAGLLASTASASLTDPKRVCWLCSAETMQAFQPEEFALGSVAFVKQGVARRSELGMNALRAFNTFFQRLSDAQKAGGPIYLIMLTWNRLELTIATLNRLQRNTHEPFRLVIADNGSTDGTVEWLEDNRHRFPFLEKLLLFGTNLGVGRALNNGIVFAASRSTRIGRIDNDILVPLHWLRDLNRVLQSSIAPSIVSAFASNVPEFRDAIETIDVQLVAQQRVYGVDLVGGCCTLFRPGLFNDLGFLPEVPLYGVEDGGLCKAVKGKGETIVMVETVEVEHLATPDDVPREYLVHKQKQIEIAQRDAAKATKA